MHHASRPVSVVILASALKIEDSLAVYQLLAVMLALFGHRLTPTLLPRYELVQSRSQTT